MVGAGFYVREVQETNDHDDGRILKFANIH